LDEASKKVKVHYDGFAKKWDEWLHLDLQKSRLRPLGSNDPKSREQKLKEEEEAAFRASMKARGLEIVDMEKDGNCLFRCFAHQIWGDPERHPEVRAMCCDYEESNREYFKNFVDGDFNAFLAKRRLDAWGDHIEIEALRELFNKNVMIYYSDCAKPPRPLARDSETPVPTVSLAYHGGSHYNSVIDPKTFKPFGDGKDSKVNMRQLRLDEDKKVPTGSASAVAAVAASAAAAASPARLAVAELVSIDEKELAVLWSKHDRESKKFIRFALLGDLLRAALDLVVLKKKQIRKKAGKEFESVEKAKHEIPIENIVNRYNSLRDEHGRLSWANFQAQFTKETLPEMLGRMARMD